MESFNQQRIDWVLEYGTKELVRGLGNLGNFDRIVFGGADADQFLKLVLDKRLPASSQEEALLYSNYATEEIFNLLIPAAKKGLKDFINLFFFGVFDEHGTKRLFGVGLQQGFHHYQHSKKFPFSSDLLAKQEIHREGPNYYLIYE